MPLSKGRRKSLTPNPSPRGEGSNYRQGMNILTYSFEWYCLSLISLPSPWERGTGVRLVMVRLVEAFSLLSSLTKLKTT